MHYGFLVFLLTYAVHTAADIETNEISTGCSSDYDCKYLYDHIVNHVDPSKDVCKDVYSFTCQVKNELGIFSENFMKAQYKKLIERVEYSINDDSYMAKFKPIEKERELYKLCMNYGDEQAKHFRTQEKLRFLKEMYNNASHGFIWGIVDQKLYNEGFGHAFFNIRVIPNPRNVDQNIIMLEPPTFDSYAEIHEALKLIEEFSTKYDKFNKSDIEELLHRYVTSDKLKNIQKLVQSVTEAIFNSTTDFTDNGSKVTTIGAWYNDFIKIYERSSVARIDWFRYLATTFNEVEVDNIDYKTPILVKNKMYFSKLFDIFFETSNEVIATSIVVKAIAENIKYIDWNLATNLKLVSDKYRSEFCLHNTKLYGFSYGILKEYKKQPNSDLHQLTNKIIRTFISEIEESIALSYSNETYLKSELDTITAYVHKPDVYFARMVEQFYKGNNIHNDFDPYREIIYGRYGVQIASVLYALLNENKLEDYSLRRYNHNTLKSHLSAHPNYSLDKMRCVIPGVHKDNKKQFIEAMSNVYGLQIAHTALRPSKNDLPLFPKLGLYHIRQFFHLEYIKAHCYMEKDTINSIVLHDEPFYTAFRKCKNSIVKCPKSAAFDRLSKNVFLI
ncbi:hypothetical protein TSAR_006709 [Trichomalopsis sarcophagae]|uniref:Peptidase M13 N-terminal domain-containing protein n=1 Tax=Trichomalopsis sarcophagae TaxID=543379 RepID=A0A232EZG1_9HYME|nr:hypothetical protein TSAR_006709 [Trichomalopsis sarcophagae]